jgi:hypothetical protein
MAATVAVQVVPPPVPEHIPTSTAIYLAISTVVCVSSFLALVWTVVSRDARSNP